MRRIKGNDSDNDDQSDIRRRMIGASSTIHHDILLGPLGNAPAATTSNNASVQGAVTNTDGLALMLLAGETERRASLSAIPMQSFPPYFQQQQQQQQHHHHASHSSSSSSLLREPSQMQRQYQLGQNIRRPNQAVANSLTQDHGQLQSQQDPAISNINNNLALLEQQHQTLKQQLLLLRALNQDPQPQQQTNDTNSEGGLQAAATRRQLLDNSTSETLMNMLAQQLQYQQHQQQRGTGVASTNLGNNIATSTEALMGPVVQNRFPPTAAAAGHQQVPFIHSNSAIGGPAATSTDLPQQQQQQQQQEQSEPNLQFGSGRVRIVSGSGYRHITPFPWRLHEILQSLQEQNKDHIASWVPPPQPIDTGEVVTSCFKIHDVDLFTKDVIPTYFKHGQFKSFQRQLHIYGFKRIGSGERKGAYYHKYFVRGNRSLCQRITRDAVKAGGGSVSKSQIASQKQPPRTTAPTITTTSTANLTKSIEGDHSGSNASPRTNDTSKQKSSPYTRHHLSPNPEMGSTKEVEARVSRPPTTLPGAILLPQQIGITSREYTGLPRTDSSAIRGGTGGSLIPSILNSPLKQAITMMEETKAASPMRSSNNARIPNTSVTKDTPESMGDYANEIISIFATKQNATPTGSATSAAAASNQGRPLLESRAPNQTMNAKDSNDSSESSWDDDVFG